MNNQEEKAASELQDRASNGCIACAQALSIARAAGVPTQRIGALLDEKGIKIVECQLGCFGWKNAKQES